jgi:ABC-2 type transport system permease protein
MQKLLPLIYKDSLLLLRDRAGLCMMFLMPLLLVVIMTCLQDSTFNAVRESHIPLLLLNRDSGALGVAIERQINASGMFTVSCHSRGGAATDREALIQAVARGDFMIGIIVPDRATETIRANVTRYIAALFSGAEAAPVTDSVQVEIYIDPATKPSFRHTLMTTLREYAVRTESAFMFNAVTEEVNRIAPISIAPIRLSQHQVVFREQYASSTGREGDRAAIPTSTQHNIPAWSLFAVFFITISLSGNLIKERDEGSFTRLQTLPCPYSLYLLSKMVTYLAVCLLQYILIFAVGIWILPRLGLPALALRLGQLPLLLWMGGCSALAAIGYGLAIGKIAATHQQAAIFASVSVVIMAAVGGIWIPVFVMPEPMRLLSAASPLNWGMEGFYSLLIREGSLESIVPESLALLAFAAGCMVLAVIYKRDFRF